MLDKDIYQSHLRNILVNLYKDSRLANTLVFKGGTAAYFFYDLPRFSTDLDFDLLHMGNSVEDDENYVFERITEIVGRMGYTIREKFKKLNTIFWLISYGDHLSNIKIEVSKRSLYAPVDRGIQRASHDTRLYYGESLLVMSIGDLIAQKLLAIMGSDRLANRDLFDAHFFLSSKYATKINYVVSLVFNFLFIDL